MEGRGVGGSERTITIILHSSARKNGGRGNGEQHPALKRKYRNFGATGREEGMKKTTRYSIIKRDIRSE